MNIIEWIIITTIIAGIGGTGLGGFAGAIMTNRDSNKIVSLLLSFAGGIMLSVVCFDLIDSAIHPNATSETDNLLLVIVGIISGYIIIFLLNYFIDKATNHEVKHIDDKHPKTADNLNELIHEDHYEEHKKMNSKYQLFIGGVVMACAIALHNLPEGMVIGASFANSVHNNTVFTGSGLIMAVVIGLHNIPEGMAVSVPLISGGMKKMKAVMTTAATGAPTVIGALIGYSLGMIGPNVLAICLSFASGAMLYVVFGELIPEGILMWKSKTPAFATLVGMIVGLAIINV